MAMRPIKETVMKYLKPAPILGLLFVLLVGGWALGGDLFRRHCCPHCQSQEGVCYKEVVEHVCRLVEERKPIKKTVYECKEVPYCQHKPAKFFQCDSCPECQACPKYKKVLIKKEIVCGEKCTTKCVVDEVIRKVPCCNHCQAEVGQPVQAMVQETDLAPPAPVFVNTDDGLKLQP